MKIGIDKISFYIPKHYLDLKDLAKARNVDPDKYNKGLLINKMSVTSETEDIITMAASASLNILTKADIKQIDLVIFTTETGIDYSKAAATHLISILGLRNNIRAVEMKQACYSTTAAIYFARGHILQNPNAKVLILASDISKYELKSAGEPTQGAGAVAMIISQSPRILEIEKDAGYYSENSYDFYRPNDLRYALVDGKQSNDTYQRLFLETFTDYKNKTNLTINDFSSLIFHIPYSKLGLKSLLTVSDDEALLNNYDMSTTYNREVGNIYTGSLFLSLISLLEQANLLAGDRIGMYAYGSGAVAEFFTGILVDGYKNHLLNELHQQYLTNRKQLTVAGYEAMVLYKHKKEHEYQTNTNLSVQLKTITNYQRSYQINK